MKSFEEIRTMLAEKITTEKKRLKSYSTHANSFDLANALGRHVEALMTSSRYSELKRIIKKRPKWSTDSYLQERLRATKKMSEALENFAKDSDGKRPWRYVDKKHRHHSSKKDKHKSKHRSRK